MASVSLSAFLSVAIVSPLSIPIIYILVDHWRYSRRAISVIAVCLVGFLALFDAATIALLGMTELASTIVGYVSPVICAIVYLSVCRFRDGRLLFTLMTAMVIATINEMIVYTITDPSSTLSLAVRVALCLIESLVLYFVCRRPFLNMLDAVYTGWMRLSILPVSFFVCLLLSHTIPVRILDQHSPFGLILSWILSFLAVFTYLTIYYLLTTIGKQQAAEQGMALLNTQISLLGQQMEQLLAEDRDNRTFRHDVRHFINMMQGLCAMEDTGSAKKLLADMGMRLDELTASRMMHRYTGNPLIDMVLSSAGERAKREGVVFTVRLSLPSELPVEATELAAVVINALENAMEATADQDEGEHKEIRIYNSFETDQFFLSIRNTCRGTIQLDGDTGLPRTEDGTGYATQSIAAFAKRHGAFLSYGAKDGWFSLGILM